MWHTYLENIKEVVINYPAFARQISHSLQAGFPLLSWYAVAACAMLALVMVTSC